jgi:catechol 2,3-dioxygenase-like lactoylglutathione lyase family enzyme
MAKALTRGVHHLGLTTPVLEETAKIFTGVLGWQEVARIDYPAVFVSDGAVLVTLWAAKDEHPQAFDRHKNIGLHHVAFAVPDDAALRALHQKLQANGIPIEFAPQPVGGGPAEHTICYAPGGLRVEFFCAGK